jgi:hypothetical protein
MNRDDPMIPTEDKNKWHYGLIAQELLDIYPECVSEYDNLSGQTRYGVNYTGFIPHLIGAIQLQNTTITTLQTTVQDLTNTINSILAKYPI